MSTLHVIHHGIMPLFAWEACRFVPGGHESFGALFNTFVHVVMYAYYFLAAFGPTFQPYLWWKRYLTRLQMFQFACVLGEERNLIFVRKYLDQKWLKSHFKSFYNKKTRKSFTNNCTISNNAQHFCPKSLGTLITTILFIFYTLWIFFKFFGAKFTHFCSL